MKDGTWTIFYLNVKIKLYFILYYFKGTSCNSFRVFKKRGVYCTKKKKRGVLNTRFLLDKINVDPTNWK